MHAANEWRDHYKGCDNSVDCRNQTYKEQQRDPRQNGDSFRFKECTATMQKPGHDAMQCGEAANCNSNQRQEKKGTQLGLAFPCKQKDELKWRDDKAEN